MKNTISRMSKTLLAIAVTASFSPVTAMAEETANNENYNERMLILGSSNQLRKETGSATMIDEVQLEKFAFDDIARVLYSVPGINIREEDGFGLRPNIGIRGATPERSRKINITEDGVLIGPAPYSAASAYYFPMMAKMTAVEVFKGPAAIKYGPNTVAGTVNMATRAVPDSSEGMLDLAVGTDGYTKAHAYYGDTIGNFGFLLEAINLQSDGFKDLDGGGDTGFDKNDVMLKLRYDLDGKHFNQVFEVKLAYADEISDETYLGLTDADFRENPNRRYRASQLAEMDWEHTQVQFNHFLEGKNFDVTTRIYRNDFERDWFKANSFKGGLVDISFQELLADPFKDESSTRFYQILTGEIDSVQEFEKLLIGNNGREYYTQGIQSDLRLNYTLAGLEHRIEAGFRYHEDEIERNHTEDAFNMRSGVLVSDGSAQVATTTDREYSEALSVYIQDTVSYHDFDFTVGVRGEFIDSEYQNRAPGEEGDYLNKSFDIWLPSFSVFYTLSEHAGLLFGVHEGFLPTSPRQEPEIDIENSINYEFGGRYNDGTTSAEAIVFFNDIENLKEGCQFSSCGTNDDTEFNGGEVDIWGLELSAAHQFSLDNGWEIPVSLVYTFTDSEFKTSFDSGFDMWGSIEEGDELPYLPENQLTVSIGLVADKWEVNLITRYIDEMLEASGDNVVLSGVSTDSLVTVDLSASYQVTQNGQVYLKVDNLFDEQEIVSRRPFGARPSKDQQAFIGYKHNF